MAGVSTARRTLPESIAMRAFPWAALDTEEYASYEDLERHRDAPGSMRSVNPSAAPWLRSENAGIEDRENSEPRDRTCGMLPYRRKWGRVPGTVQPPRSEDSRFRASNLCGRETGAVRGSKRERVGQFGFLGIVHQGIVRPCLASALGHCAASAASSGREYRSARCAGFISCLGAGATS